MALSESSNPIFSFRSWSLPTRCGVISPFLGFWWAFMTIAMNRMQQEWHWVMLDHAIQYGFHPRSASKARDLCDHAQKGPMFGLMLYCCRLEILSNYWRRNPTFSICNGLHELCCQSCFHMALNLLGHTLNQSVRRPVMLRTSYWRGNVEITWVRERCVRSSSSFSPELFESSQPRWQIWEWQIFRWFMTQTLSHSADID